MSQKQPPTLLPEDVYAAEGDVLSPFAKDVYLLALVAHKICFHGAKFVLEEGIPVWRSIPNDPFDGELNTFFAKAMDLEPENRFANASEMLAELNTLAIGKPLQYDDTGGHAGDRQRRLHQGRLEPLHADELLPSSTGCNP
ncbi:hypothetical protein N1Z41_00000175 [Pseudomonas aeruginosa]